MGTEYKTVAESVKVVESGIVYTRSGHSPYIDRTTKTWWEYDDKKQEYFDTGILVETGIIDAELSDTSTNPVQNKVITREVKTKISESSIKELKAIDIDAMWEAV